MIVFEVNLTPLFIFNSELISYLERYYNKSASYDESQSLPKRSIGSKAKVNLRMSKNVSLI